MKNNAALFFYRWVCKWCFQASDAEKVSFASIKVCYKIQGELYSLFVLNLIPLEDCVIYMESRGQ